MWLAGGHIKSARVPLSSLRQVKACQAWHKRNRGPMGRWRVGSRHSAGPGTEDWLTGTIAVGGADACGSVGAGAGTEPPTRRSGADETSTVNREATSATRIVWAGLWRPNPRSQKQHHRREGASRRPCDLRPVGQVGAGLGEKRTAPVGTPSLGLRRPTGPGTEDWLAGATTADGATSCGSVEAGAGTEPPTQRSGADETSTVNPSPPGSTTTPPASGSLPAPRAP
ncbi:hypothetical protein NDU88_010152 [Pleurodeles waltl]|uniref:Uncharacterized protein n=1 Tax=Pleurodeles waltl TaxID=8319 RepID=A0AAV7QV36_PLEWA|nr:hypothetical protein NDU88_010152 [Pleurodeles waltl]